MGSHAGGCQVKRQRLVAAAIALALAGIAVAAGKPLAITLSPASQTIFEGQRATLTLSKSGGNGRPTAAMVTTSDGSWSGSVVPGTSFVIPVADDTIINGTRTVTVTAVASTGAIARATLTITDNDVAPPATQTCPDGTVISAAATCPPLTQQCPDGSFVSVGEPCPTPPPAAQPTYGDTVVALQPCIGRYIPDPLVVGTQYKVRGRWVGAPIGTPSLPLGTPPDGVILTPVVDDGVHRGDGWFAYWVPFDCVARVP